MLTNVYRQIGYRNSAIKLQACPFLTKLPRAAYLQPGDGLSVFTFSDQPLFTYQCN